MTDAVLLEVKDDIATLTLNRPQALNALDQAMVDGLSRALDTIEADPSIRIVVLTGAGEHFMAGGDVKMFHQMLAHEPAARSELTRAVIEQVHAMVERLAALPQPVIAKVRGAVAGFGVSLLGMADLAAASETMYLSVAYCHIGTSPDGSSTYSLPRLLGMKKAKELALLGERIDAKTAAKLGLVNRVLPDDQLDAMTEMLARHMAKGPAIAYANTKRLLNQSLGNSLSEQLAAERDGFAQCAATADFAEGVTAFVEKRKPRFTGA